MTIAPAVTSRFGGKPQRVAGAAAAATLVLLQEQQQRAVEQQ